MWRTDLLEQIVVSQPDESIIHSGLSDFEVSVTVVLSHHSDHQERQTTNITGKESRKPWILGGIEYAVFIASLTILFPVDTHDQAFSSDEHLFT